MSIRTILVASMLASLGAIVGQESAVFAQPVLPPPPAPMFQPEPEQPAPEPAQAPPAPSYNQQQQPQQPYPPPQQPAQAYPPPAQPYPGPQQQPQQPYPPPQQPATGYPQPGQGYPPPQPQGYPPPQPQGYPPPQPQGYPPPQPQGYPPPQPQGYPPPQPQGYPPPQDYPAPAQPAPRSESVFSNPLSKLQVGFHLATGSIDTPDDPIRKSGFSSFGIFARYRFNQRWEAELAVASESGTIESNRAKREFTPITASGLWHVFDIRGVDLYARFGLGRSTEVYDHPDFKALEAPATHFHIGAGGSYIFRRNIGAGVEIRQQWINRAGTESIDELGGRGTTYSLVGSYHF